MREWFETFFEGLYGRVLMGTFDSARTLQQAQTVKTLLGLRKGRRALDIPCGNGRLTLPLARMGCAMTGVDLTGAFLRRGRKEARRQSLDVRFIRCDMRDICFDSDFDAAFNWFGSFGYFSDPENLDFCKKVLRALKPGGCFLVEGLNKTCMLAHFRPVSDQVINGVRVRQRTRFDHRANRSVTLWTMSKGTKRERHNVRMRMFNGQEMRSLLRAAGFTEIRLYGYPPAGRLTRHSRRLIAVAKRPRT